MMAGPLFVGAAPTKTAAPAQHPQHPTNCCAPPRTLQVQKIKDYGYMHMGAWDLLLSITGGCAHGKTSSGRLGPRAPSAHTRWRLPRPAAARGSVTSPRPRAPLTGDAPLLHPAHRRPAAKAMLAAEVLRPGQLVCIVPGCLAITRKTSLVRSLVNAYGHVGAASAPCQPPAWRACTPLLDPGGAP
jgi:hypothetical protein